MTVRLTFGASLLTLALLVPPVSAAPAELALAGGGSEVVGMLEEPTLGAVEHALKGALARLEQPVGAVDQAVIEAVRAFYDSRGHRPVWLRDGAPTAQAAAWPAIAAAAEEEGLQAQDYAAPGVPEGSDPQALAAYEAELSVLAARYVTHLRSGRARPGAVSATITMKPERPDLREALLRLSRAPDVAAALAAFRPPHPEYDRLRVKLGELRAAAEPGPAVRVSKGPALKPGASGERVRLLRQRLGIADGTDPDRFDEDVLTAVKAFQAERGLEADGIVGPATLFALNGPDRAEEIAAIVLNMERWRWMPAELGRRHVFVNVPEFTVRVRRGAEVEHEARVVVGTLANQTPIFSERMDHVVVNPYWNVPVSILTKEMLPAIQADPGGYFSRRGYQVLAQAGGQLRVVKPETIDWTMIDVRSLRVRQTPGDQNALGRIKFMFPNQHAVYLHDTPSKALFGKDVRAYSHGCVRVDEPLAFAEAVFAEDEEWDAAKLERLYGGPERRINLKVPLPVHLAYFTRAVAPDGTLARFADIYRLDEKLEQALGIGRE